MSKFATLSTRRSATPSLTVCAMLHPSPVMEEAVDLEEDLDLDPVEPVMVMELLRAQFAGSFIPFCPILTLF